MNAITTLAILQFEKSAKAEIRAQKLNSELLELAMQIPSEDMDEYVKITEEIERRLNTEDE